jgi:hypothetical protein
MFPPSGGVNAQPFCVRVMRLLMPPYARADTRPSAELTETGSRDRLGCSLLSRELMSAHAGRGSLNSQTIAAGGAV